MKLHLGKRAVIYSMMTIFATSQILSGCGKGSRQTLQSGPTFIYEGEFTKLHELREQERLVKTAFVGNELYFVTAEYLAEKSITRLYKKNIESGECVELPFEQKDNMEVYALADNGKGGLYEFSGIYDYDEKTGESSNQLILYEFDANGTKISEKEFPEITKDESYVYVSCADISEDGNLYFYLDSSQTAYRINLSTNETKKVPLTGWCTAVAATQGGAYFVVQDESSTIKFWNGNADGFDEKSVSLASGYLSNVKMTIGEDNKIYCDTGNILYEMDSEKNELIEKLRWLDSDIIGNNIGGMRVLEDGRILVVTGDIYLSDPNVECAVLTKKEVTNDNAKTVLTMAVGEMFDPIMEKAIVRFNKTNGSYRIRTEQYTEKGDQTVDKQISTALQGKNAPDLLAVEGLNYTMLANRGYLMDLYQKLLNDSDIHYEDYQTNVIEASLLNEKLYTISPFFSMMTLSGKQSAIGDVNTWNLDRLLEEAKKKDQSQPLIQYMSRETLLTMFTSLNLSQYVDYSKGECDFEQEQFRKVLQLAACFPKEEDYDQKECDLYINTYFDVFGYQIDELRADKELVNIGLPTTEGMETIANQSYSLTVAVTEKSKYQDAAWEFVKTLLQDEVQVQQDYYGIPLKKSAIQKLYEDAQKKEYEKDENGNETDKEKARYSVSIDDGEVYDIYSLTSEQIQKFQNMIDEIHSVYIQDQEIVKIISEEATAYFEGQKNEDDTIRVIQSRVKLYLQEKM